MIQKIRIFGIAILFLTAMPVLAADPGEMPNIQIGIPADLTLAQARKEAHAKADKLDKMTPQEFAEGQRKFREDMAKISQMPPQEKQSLYPGVPDSLLAHLGHSRAVSAGMAASPEDALAAARKNAHTHAGKLDTMSEAEWNERKQKMQALIDQFESAKPENPAPMPLPGQPQ